MCVLGCGLWEEVGYMDTTGNRDSQLAFRSALHDITVIDSLIRSVVSKWDSPKAESALATASTTSLLVA